MLHFYLKSGDRILLVDDAKVEMDNYDKELKLVFRHCKLPDVIHFGDGIYDAIIFPTRPPNGILKKAFEKVCVGGIVIIQGIENIVRDANYQVLRGDPKMLVMRRQPAPPN